LREALLEIYTPVPQEFAEFVIRHREKIPQLNATRSASSGCVPIGEFSYYSLCPAHSCQRMGPELPRWEPTLSKRDAGGVRGWSSRRAGVRKTVVMNGLKI
jgi:hypothetical protein